MLLFDLKKPKMILYFFNIFFFNLIFQIINLAITQYQIELLKNRK